MTVDTKVIVAASAHDGALCLHWEDALWKNWADLVESQEYMVLVEAAKTKKTRISPSRYKRSKKW